MENIESSRLKNSLLVKILCLILIAIIGFIVEKFFHDIFLFSLSMGYKTGIWNFLWMLPVLLVVHVLIQQKVSLKKFIPLYFLLIFLLLSPLMAISLLYILFFISLYYIEKYSRTSKVLGPVLISIFTLMIFVPLSLYTFKMTLTPIQTYFLILFKSCFLMRVLSWYIDRKVYQRTHFDTLSEYVEFIFCPIFFIFPGQIQFFLFDYFHKNKTIVSHSENSLDSVQVVWLAVWGYFLMIIYSLMDHYFWNQYNNIPGMFKLYGFWPSQLMIGFYWLIVIYVQQTAGMAYQVSLGRVMGYNFKYDMHWPLLARSPLDYLRRHSSYVKDYIVEMGLKPLALFSLRKGYAQSLVVPVTSIAAYSFFIMIQTGYRPDYNRAWGVTFVMIGFLVFAIAISYYRTFFGKHFTKLDQTPESLLSDSSYKKLKNWNALDYLKWALTLVVLSSYKMLLGLAK